MASLIQKTDYENLDVITANLNLLTANMEVTMDRVRPQQTRLKNALQQVKDNYDFCVIDNAPDINVSVINALTAADDVLIPVEVDDNTTEIKKLNRKKKTVIQTNVSGSNPEFPYNPQHFKIQGTTFNYADDSQGRT